MTQQLNVAAILRMARAPVVRAPVAISADQIQGATPGCYAMHISDAEYHGTAPGVSSTGLKKLLRSPAHYRAYLEEKDNDTQSRRLGRAIHAWVLENHIFNDKFVVWRGGARRGKAFDTFEVANTGKTILTEDDMLTVQGCGQALVNDPAFPVRGFLEGMQDSDGNQVVAPAKTEFSIFWTDEETGVQCKVRLDAVRLEEPVIALDLKSTDDARPHEFTRQMLRLDYDLQAAFYVEGVRRFVGHECPFIFGAVEIDKPHGTAFYALSPGHDMMENGRRKMRHALQLKARCDRENRYPGYSFASVMEPTMAPWMAFEAPTADAPHLQAA